MAELSDREIRAGATHLLERNWCDGYTRPARRLYPHQWNWDSAFIAIGYASYDIERAIRELRSLLRGQWANGMVPHIVFSAQPGYFPGPDFWRTDLSADAPRDPPTSGITNPPVLAGAVLDIHRRTGSAARDFVAEAFPRLVAWQRYFYRERDPRREGLAYLRHPWESGTDNSPAWDSVLARIRVHPGELPRHERRDLAHVPASQRPTRDDYDRYVWLIELYKRVGYRESEIAAECPFVVQDPLFNAALCRANEALLELAESLGEDPGELREWHAQTTRALEEKLWDEEKALYVYFDLESEERIHMGTASSFAPLWAGVPSPERARAMAARLQSPTFSGAAGDGFLVPSHELDSPAFDPLKYWRGPVWMNLNWLIAHGLERYGERALAGRLRDDALTLVRRYGFREYFSPFRTEDRGPVGGYGSEGFSWTAALSIDLLAAEHSGDGS